MRILILTCNTGEGHNSCARAIKEVCNLRGEECSIEDTLSFLSKTISKVISKGHVFVYRHLPGLFRWGYRHMEANPKLYRPGSAVHSLLTRGGQKLAAYINEGAYDAVICTHVFSGVMLTAAKPLCEKALKTAFVATDYTCSPTAEESDLDTYFIPDEALREEFAAHGISEQKLVASGIPVRQMFFFDETKELARKVMGIDPAHKHLVVMCGSMGCGPLKKLAEELAGKLSDQEDMSIVCGTNKRLLRWMKRKLGKCPNVHILGYVENVSRLMDAADVYLTKPGGISVTEAKTKALPMVFINAVAGCEEHNRQFFSDLGGAVTADTIEDLACECIRLLRKDWRREEMQAALLAHKQQNPAVFICDHLASATAGDN